MKKTVIMKKTKNKIKYAYFDLDGTLLNSDKKITKATLKSLEWLKNQGVKIGIATGRPYYLALEIIKAVNPDLPTVSINGNLIFNNQNKTSYYHKKHNKKTLERIIDYVSEHKINFMVYTDKEIQYKEYIKSRHLFWLRNNKKSQPDDCKTPITTFKNNLENVLKILITSKDSSDYDEKKIFDFFNSFNDSYLVRSAVGLLDFMPSDINKASGLKSLEEKGIIKLDETIVFGDSNNDIDMIKTAAVSVAMKNSNKNIHQVADYITKYTNDEEGVGEFIYDFFQKCDILR